MYLRTKVCICGMYPSKGGFMSFVTKCKSCTVTHQRVHKRGFCILYPQGVLQ